MCPGPPEPHNGAEAARKLVGVSPVRRVGRTLGVGPHGPTRGRSGTPPARVLCTTATEGNLTMPEVDDAAPRALLDTVETAEAD